MMIAVYSFISDQGRCLCLGALLLTVVLPAEAVTMDAGNAHTCAVMANGTVQCWGANSNGQLGDGTTTARHSPVTVPKLTGVYALSTGLNHTCAATDNGVFCWGENSSGQLGDGSTTYRLSPVSVAGLAVSEGARVKDVAAGDNHSCAVLEDATVRCWGGNGSGQLGNGTTQFSAVPVAVTGLNHAIAISAGEQNTCAVVSNGTLFCWGDNSDGDLADGTQTKRLTPVAAHGVSHVSLVSMGDDLACAVDGGALKCWGKNDDGEVGTGIKTKRERLPALVAGIDSSSQADKNTAVVSAGNDGACGIRAGALLCWGKLSPSGAPTAVGSDAAHDYLAVSVGNAHACALRATGALACWGANQQGQLGDGTTTKHPTPMPVLTGVMLPTAIAPPTNTAPEAGQAVIHGSAQIGQTLTGAYQYNDAEGDGEGASQWQWLRADDAAGVVNRTAIAGATARQYAPTTADIGKYLVFTVTPVAVSGQSPGQMRASAAMGPVPAPPANTRVDQAPNNTLADFNLQPDELSQVNADLLEELSPETLAEFTAQQIIALPADSFRVLSASQATALTPPVVAALSLEQFRAIPAASFAGWTAAQLAALPEHLVQALTRAHMDALSVSAMNALDAGDATFLLLNLDLRHVALEQVQRIVPEDFEYHAQTGDFLPPPGSVFQPIALPATPSRAIQAIQMASTLSVGDQGQSASFLQRAQQTLAATGLDVYFTQRQDEEGVLHVEGNEQVGQIAFAFIPDAARTVRLATGATTTAHLELDHNGFFHITQADGVRFQVTPTPKDSAGVQQVTGAESLYQGLRGEVMLTFSTESTRRRGQARAVGLFDPLVEPPPSGLCVESASGAPQCDFAHAPEPQRPGIHLQPPPPVSGNSTRNLSARIVYPDGSSQLLRSTILDPDAFIRAAAAVPGVESVHYLADGSLLAIVAGQPFRIWPNFNVASAEASPDAQATVELTAAGQLRYTLPWTEPGTEVRRQGRTREALVFTPQLDPMPSDLCIMIDNQLRCDFHTLP